MGTYESYQSESFKGPKSESQCAAWDMESNCTIDVREQTTRATEALFENGILKPLRIEGLDEPLTAAEQATLPIILNALHNGNWATVLDIARTFDDAKSFDKLIGNLIGSEDSAMGISWKYLPNQDCGVLKVAYGNGDHTDVQIGPPQHQQKYRPY
jgi:hypothetical protein